MDGKNIYRAPELVDLGDVVSATLGVNPIGEEEGSITKFPMMAV